MNNTSCKGNFITNLFLALGTLSLFACVSFYIAILDKKSYFKVTSISMLGIILVLLSYVIMLPTNTISKICAKIFLVFYLAFFIFFTSIIALAIKSNTIGYCIQTTGALVKKILSEDLAFQNKIIPTSTLISAHLTLLTNLIIHSPHEETIKTASICNYHIVYKKQQDLHSLFSEIFIHNNYYFKTDNQTPFIIDGGSNIGMTILYFKKLYPNATILGFEPEKANHMILSQNMAQNKLNNVTLIEKALSDKEETVQFYTKPNQTNRTASIFKTSQDSYPVKCTKLSSYITRPVDFLKLDIEGAETLVIQELAQAQKLSMIKEINMEYHHHLDNGKDYLSIILKTFEDNGFGYIIRATEKQPFVKGSTQFLTIYAYKK